ncbi:hypothetical protein LD112_25015 [Pantoea agglomerans]|nr:hypothetical protein [Pantoea agglomerans]
MRDNTLLMMRKTFKLSFFQSMFSQVFSPLPTLLALPLLLSGKITMGGPDANYNGLRHATQHAGLLSTGLSIVYQLGGVNQPAAGYALGHE